MYIKYRLPWTCLIYAFLHISAQASSRITTQATVPRSLHGEAGRFSPALVQGGVGTHQLWASRSCRPSFPLLGPAQISLSAPGSSARVWKALQLSMTGQDVPQLWSLWVLQKYFHSYSSAKAGERTPPFKKNSLSFLFNKRKHSKTGLSVSN